MHFKDEEYQEVTNVKSYKKIPENEHEDKTTALGDWDARASENVEQQ